MRKFKSLRAKIQRCTAVFMMAVLFTCSLPVEYNPFVSVGYANTLYPFPGSELYEELYGKDTTTGTSTDSDSDSSSSATGFTSAQLAAIEEMASNSAAWYMAQQNGDTELMDALHEANVELANTVADGGTASYDSKTGTWDITDDNDNSVSSSSSQSNKNKTASYEITESTGDKSETTSQSYTSESIEAFKDAGGTTEGVIDSYNNAADLVAETNDYDWDDPDVIAQVALSEASLVQEALGLTDEETAELAQKLADEKNNYENLNTLYADAILSGNTDLADSIFAQMEEVHDETQELRESYGYDGDMLGYEDGGFFDPFSFEATQVSSSSSSSGGSSAPDPDPPEEPTVAPTGSFNINSYAEKGGYITPLGNTTVEQGKNQSYKFAPYDGYALSDIVVDGTSVFTSQYASTYTFSSVQTDHTIVVSFTETGETVVTPAPTITLKEYTITSSVGAGQGTITPEGDTTVLHGRNQSYLFTPATGYRISDVLVDGVSVIDDVVRADDSYYQDMLEYNDAYDEYLVNQANWAYYNQNLAEYEDSCFDTDSLEQYCDDWLQTQYWLQIIESEAQAATEAYEQELAPYQNKVDIYAQSMADARNKTKLADATEDWEDAVAERDEFIADYRQSLIDDCFEKRTLFVTSLQNNVLSGSNSLAEFVENNLQTLCSNITLYSTFANELTATIAIEAEPYWEYINESRDSGADDRWETTDLYDKAKGEIAVATQEMNYNVGNVDFLLDVLQNYGVTSAIGVHAITITTEQMNAILDEVDASLGDNAELPKPTAPTDTITEPIEPTVPSLPTRDVAGTAKAPDSDLTESAGGFQELEQGMYTFYNVTSNHTIVVEFESASYVEIVDVALYDYKDRDVGIIKSGYGVFTDVQVYYDHATSIAVTASYNFGAGNKTTALSETSVGVFEFPVNSTSSKSYRCIYIPVEALDQDYTIEFTITATGIDGATITDTLTKTFTVNGNMYEDDFTGDS